MVKLFAFDLEGTLLDPHPRGPLAAPSGHAIGLWPLLVHLLGPKAIETDHKLAEQWDSDGFRTYCDWCDASLSSLKASGLTRTLFDHAIREFTLNPGVREVITELHSRDVITTIISGGFAEQARQVQADLRIRHSYAAVDVIWGDDGYPIHWNLLPADYVGKKHFLQLLMDEYGLRKGECFFVGDGKNDVFLAEMSGCSFAYRAHQELRKVATFCISEFGEILEHITG